MPIDWRECFERAHDYAAFLEAFGSNAGDDRARWARVFDGFELSGAHRSVLDGFVRDMNVLCLAGVWCGDCVDQCPILEHFARACPKIQLRFADRDAEPDLAAQLRICGGGRVPVVVFLAEDFAECARYGDRTLSRYRALAAGQGLIAPADSASRSEDTAELADDWLREFERVQLMLRLSPRLRRLHGD